jgi:acetylornithine aminotransferase
VLRRGFEQLGWSIVGSVAGLYLWVQVEDDLAVTTRLLDRRIIVSPGRAFGAGGEGYIRLALVPTLEECERAVEVLVDTLST